MVFSVCNCYIGVLIIYTYSTPHHLELILWLKVCNRYDGFCVETMFKEIKMHFLYSFFFCCNFLFYVKKIMEGIMSWLWLYILYMLHDGKEEVYQEMYCISNFFLYYFNGNNGITILAI